MVTAHHQQTGPGLRIWKVAVALSVYLLAFGGFACFAAAHCNPHGLMATLTFVECAVLAIVVALFAVDQDPHEVGVLRFVLRLAAICGLTLAVSAAVLGLAAAVWGATPLAGGLVAQVVILSFCLLLVSVFALVRCSGSELLLAQLVCILVACALMGTVFYADPVVEAQKSPEARGMMIAAVLSSNPLTAISWSLLEFDLLRRQIMYDRISVIGRFYRTPSPQWRRILCGYVAVSAVMLTGAGLLRRHRVLKLSRRGEKNQ